MGVAGGVAAVVPGPPGRDSAQRPEAARRAAGGVVEEVGPPQHIT